MYLSQAKLRVKLREIMTMFVIISVNHLLLKSRHPDGRVQKHTTKCLDSANIVERS